MGENGHKNHKNMKKGEQKENRPETHDGTIFPMAPTRRNTKTSSQTKTTPQAGSSARLT
jgi:hypothetical protein